MKRVLVLVTVSLALTGCGADVTPKAKPGNVNEITKTLEDGRQVTCLVYASGYRGGLSCDWENAS